MTKNTMSKWEEQECTGPHCNHESSETHYILTHDDISKVRAEALEEAAEVAEKTHDEMVLDCMCGGVIADEIRALKEKG